MTTVTFDDEDRAELAAYRNGYGQLAQDPMHAGQPVHETRDQWDEPSYWLQITHSDVPLWQCHVCGKGNLGPKGGTEPEKCVGCEHGTADDMTPLLYAESVVCRSWVAKHGGQCVGPCLIAGSDGCECNEEDHIR